MNRTSFNEIVKDIQSFADDEYDVIADSNKGDIIFCRNGKDISITIYEDEDTGTIMVNYGENSMPYLKYLREVLAELDFIAEKIIQKHNPESHFIDSQSILYNEIEKKIEGSSLDILENEINGNYSGTKICFVTADAGHGKSMLLKQFQYKKAIEYIDKKSKYIFLHIDLHGRDLVRLNEAIMFELAELRVRGIYYSTILTLVKRKLIVLGIDGFDELAVEIGGEKALGSLSSFVSQMDGNGALIAASRRTFFDTQNYIKQTRILHNYIDRENSCMFDEIRIKNWEKEQCIKYLDEYTYTEKDYENLVKFLNPKNPLLARPYLFTKLVQFSYDDNISPAEFVNKTNNRLDTINEIIEAFIRREVNKFSPNDNITGKPYLTFEQHMIFLATVAEEMWNNKKDFLSKDSIQLLLTILLEEWRINEDIKHKVLRMIDSYALFVNTNENDRKFDHEEFKNYFLAIALSAKIENAVVSEQWNNVSEFLNNAQLPDSVADYMSKKLNENIKIKIVKGLLKSIIQKEWKPTYVQPNVGTIIPYILDRLQHEDIIEINNVIFSSLVFENKKIQNIVFNKCTFTNISYRHTELNNIKFENCTFSGLKINGSDNKFNNVLITNSCEVNDISYSTDGINYESEYSPIQIKKQLNALGIRTIATSELNKDDKYSPTEFYKTMKKFINKFSKVSWIYKKNIEDSSYISNNPKMVIDEIIPLLEQYNIIKTHTDEKTKQASTISYALRYEINDILKAEDDKKSMLYQFWDEVKRHQ